MDDGRQALAERLPPGRSSSETRSGDALRIQLEPCHWCDGYQVVWPREQLVAMAQTEAEGTVYLE